MQAYEFHSVIDNGIIRIPEEYKNKITSSVKVIVLTDEKPRKHQPGKFSAIQLKTKGFKFDREAANER